MADPSWYAAAREFQDVLIPKLVEHGLDIGKRGSEGDETCKKIMSYYEMLRRSFDPMFYILLQEAFEKYLKEKAPS